MEKTKSKGQKSKEKIMEAALNLFYENGYTLTSTQEIADQCGVSQTTIFYHFKNKQTLFVAILNYVIGHNREIFAEMGNENAAPFERLKILLLANIKWALEFPQQTSMVLLLFNFATHDDEFKLLADEIISNGQKTVFDILNLSDRRTIVSNQIYARSIQQYANGVMFQILASSQPDKLAQEFEQGLDSTLQVLLKENL